MHSEGQSSAFYAADSYYKWKKLEHFSKRFNKKTLLLNVW